MQSALFEPILLNAAHSSLPRKQIPAFLYGCAWKKERTNDLVYNALSAGFRGIDVAAQPRHYREDLAGEGIRRAISEGKCKREDLFVQTKFTSVGGQDPNDLPYDPNSSVTEQVKASVLSSLRNLRHETDEKSESGYIDSLVMHSPLPTLAATEEAWRVLESFVPTRIHSLGISNVTLPVLEKLYQNVDVKPAVVQNRFYRDTEYDIPLRKYCKSRGIVYQSFWTLSANQRLLRHPSVTVLAKSARVDDELALYALVLGLEGTVVLNGTQSHMTEDLEGLEKVRQWAEENSYEWKNSMKQFGDATGDSNPGPNPVEAALAHNPTARDRYA